MSWFNRLSKRERIISYIVVTIIIAALLYNFIIEPLLEQWTSQAREIILTKAKLQKDVLTIKQKKRIDQEYKLYADKLKLKGSDEQELTLILNELEKFARGSNVKIVDMRPKPPKDQVYYRKFSVDLETESDMSSLMKFIFNVKNSAQLLKIDRININTKSSPSGTIIRASIIISKVSIK